MCRFSFTVYTRQWPIYLLLVLKLIMSKPILDPVSIWILNFFICSFIVFSVNSRYYVLEKKVVASNREEATIAFKVGALK